TFDVFGRSAPSRKNQTWISKFCRFLRNDGLYFEQEQNRAREWQWVYPPLDSYSIDSIDAINVPPLPTWVPY
ncbi:Protein CBG23955, partial [Caenorhabditis briggsae]